MFGIRKPPTLPPQTLDLRRVEATPPKHRLGRMWLIAGAAVVCATAAALFGTRLLSFQHDPIPDSIRESAGYPLYYSRQLPRGFSLADRSPATLAQGIATVKYDYDGHPIVVSMQSRPKANLPEPFRLKDVVLSFGHGYVANINGNPAGVIEGDKTLVFITSEDKIEADTLAQFMRSLAPAD